MWFILYLSTELFSCSQALLEYSFMSGSTVNMNTIGFDSRPLAEALFCTRNEHKSIIVVITKITGTFRRPTTTYK